MRRRERYAEKREICGGERGKRCRQRYEEEKEVKALGEY
jgi:hypothetical protein